MVGVKELEQEYGHLADLSPEALHELLLKAQANYSRASLALQERRQQRRLHLPASEARLSENPPPRHTLIAPELGFEIQNFHLFTSGRDARSDRYHSHGDALKYYIYGSGIEDVGGQRFDVKAGDFMHIPANVWHGTINPHDEPLVFLAAQQFPGTYRQTPTPFIRRRDPEREPLEAPAISEAELASLQGRELYEKYVQTEMEFGRVSLEVDRRRQQKRLYVSAEEAPLMEWGPGRRMIMGPELGFDIYTFNLFFECLAPRAEQGGERMSGDTVKYYLAGRGVEQVGDRRLEVEAGDFVHVPANTWHATHNPYDAPLRVLSWEQIPGTYSQFPAAFLRR